MKLRHCTEALFGRVPTRFRAPELRPKTCRAPGLRDKNIGAPGLHNISFEAPAIEIIEAPGSKAKISGLQGPPL